MLIPLLLFPENQLSLMNNHYLHWLHVHHMKPVKPKMNTPPTSTNTKTEPLSLELFNRTAADLDKKEEIEIEKYKKYLFNHDQWRLHSSSQSMALI